MAYLSREERREAIIAAAIRVIIRDGFSQMTTRQVAQEADASTGIIHHHFKSTKELRNMAFARFIEQQNQQHLALIKDLTPLETLQRFFYVTFDEYETLHHILHEAWGEAQQDPILGAAYAESMKLTHGIIAAAVSAYLTQQNRPVPHNLDKTTWRVLATAVGLGDLMSQNIQLISFFDARDMLLDLLEETFHIKFT